MPVINVTDADYWTLSRDIYNDDYLKPGYKFITKKSVKRPIQDIVIHHNWKTVTSINDVNSDLQAAMVVPAEEYKSVVNYRQRPSQAIFVARGTSSIRDWKANISELAIGQVLEMIEQNYLESDNNLSNKLQQIWGFINENITDQFAKYDSFVDNCLKKYQPKRYSFTGHSLGGGHSMRQGVRHNARAVSFAGANSFITLTEQQKKAVINHQYDNKIINYCHYGDLIPNISFDNKYSNQVIGKQQFVASNHVNLTPLAVGATFVAGEPPIGTLIFIGAIITTELGQHLSSAWGPNIFESNGSIKKVSSEFESFVPICLASFKDKAYTEIDWNGFTSSDIKDLADQLTGVIENRIKAVRDVQRLENAYQEVKKMQLYMKRRLKSN